MGTSILFQVLWKALRTNVDLPTTLTAIYSEEAGINAVKQKHIWWVIYSVSAIKLQPNFGICISNWKQANHFDFIMIYLHVTFFSSRLHCCQKGSLVKG